MFSEYVTFYQKHYCIHLGRIYALHKSILPNPEYNKYVIFNIVQTLYNKLLINLIKMV